MFHLFGRGILLRLCGIVFAALACFSNSIAADPPATNSFLKLTKEHRYWWIHGSVTTTAHLIAMQDKKKGDCLSNWYLKDRQAKQELIEQAIARNPKELPTTAVLVLLTQACGHLTPPKN